jgi:hypothetical protein
MQQERRSESAILAVESVPQSREVWHIELERLRISNQKVFAVSRLERACQVEKHKNKIQNFFCEVGLGSSLANRL